MIENCSYHVDSTIRKWQVIDIGFGAYFNSPTITEHLGEKWKQFNDMENIFDYLKVQVALVLTAQKSFSFGCFVLETNRNALSLGFASN